MNSSSQVILGFDFGLKRIGVAVGQLLTKTASPLNTLKAVDGEPDWQAVEGLIKTWKPRVLIVGIPLNMNGSEQPITQSAKHFAKQLETRYQISVIGVDERLSTIEARGQLFAAGGYKAIRKAEVDSIAALFILESWLKTQ